MASHELTFKNYQKQLNDSVKLIYGNYVDIIQAKTEHVKFEVQVKSAEIVRSYQTLMQLVAEIRTYLIINDLVGKDQTSANSETAGQNTDDKLCKLRDDMSMFLYELERRDLSYEGPTRK